MLQVYSCGQIPQEARSVAADVANKMPGLGSSLHTHYFPLSLNILPVVLFTRWTRAQAGQVTAS